MTFKKKPFFKILLGISMTVGIVPLAIACGTSATVPDGTSELQTELNKIPPKFQLKQGTILSAQQFSDLFTSSNQSEHLATLNANIVGANASDVVQGGNALNFSLSGLSVTVSSVTVDGQSATAELSFKFRDATNKRTIKITNFSAPKAVNQKIVNDEKTRLQGTGVPKDLATNAVFPSDAASITSLNALNALLATPITLSTGVTTTSVTSAATTNAVDSLTVTLTLSTGTGTDAATSTVMIVLSGFSVPLTAITVIPATGLQAQTTTATLEVATYTLSPDGATAPDSLFLIFDTTNGQPSTGTQLTQADFTVAEGKVTLKTGKVLQAGTYNFSIATTTDGTGDGAIKSSSVTLTVAPAPITLASITVVPTANLIAQTAPMNGLDVATYTLGPDGATAPDSLFLIFDTTNGQPSTGTQLTQADFTVAEGKVTLKTGKVLQAGTYNFSIATTTDGTGDGAIKSSSVTLTVAPAPITLASITVVPTANLIAQTAPMNGLDVATYTLGPDGATAPDSLFLIFDTTNGQPSTGTQLTQADFTVAEGKVTLKTGKVLQAGTYNFSIATTTDGTGDGAIKSSSVTLTVAPAPITLASITVVPTANLIAQTAPMNGLDVATYTLGPDGATAPDSLFLIFDTTNGQPSTGTQLTQADFTVAEGKVTLKTGKVLQAGTYNFSIATTTDGTGDGAIKSSSVTLTVAPAPITLASITVVPTANLIAQTAPMNGLDVATYTLGPDGATAPDSLFLIFDTTNGQPSTGTQLTQADFTVAEGKVTLKTGKVLQAGTYNFSIATTTDGTGDGAIKSSSVTLTVAPAPITLASITVVPTANLIAQTAPMNGLDVATYTLGPDGATAPDSLFLIFDTTNGQPSTGTQLTQADFTVAEGKVTLKTGKVLQAGTYNFSIATTTDGTGDGAIKSSSVTLTVAPAPITLASITVVPTANLIAQTAPMNGLDVATYTLGPDGATAPDSLFLIFDTTNGQPSTGTQLTQADFTVAEGKVTLKTGKVLQAGTYNFSIATTTDGTGDGAIKSSSVTLTVAPAPITLASITVVPTANLIAQTAPMNGLDVATYTLGPDGATAPDSLFLIFDTTNGQPSTGTQLTQADFTVAEGKVTLKTGKVLQAGTYNFSIATTTDGTGDGAIKSSSVTLTVAPAPITLASITVVPTANLIAQTAPMNGLDVATYTLGPDGATAPDSLFLIFDTTNGQPSTGTQLTQADFTVAEGKVTLKTGKVLQAGTYNFSIATTTDGTGDGAIKSSSVTLTVAPAPITLASITVVPTANLIAQTAPMNGLDVATYTLGPDGATAPDSLFLIFDTTNGQPSTGTQLTQADFTVAEGKVTLKTGKVLQAGTYNFSIATTTDGTGDGAIKSSSVTLTVAPAPITLASITVVPTANLIAQTAPMNGLDVATYTLGPDGATAPDSLFLIFDTTNGQPSTGTQLTQADFTVAEGKVTLKTGKVLQAGTYNFSIATTTDGTGDGAIKSSSVTLTVAPAPITLASITVVPTANLIAQTALMNGLDVATYTLGPDGATAPDSLFLIFDTTNGQPSTGTQLTQADFTVAEGKVTLKTGKVLQAGTYNFSIATTTDGTGDGAIKSSSVTLTVAPAPITLASITVVPTANLIAQTAPMNGLDVATYTLGPDGATAPDSLFLIFDTTNGQPSTGTQLTQADFTVAEGKVTLKTGKVLQAGTYNFSIATTTDGTGDGAIKSSSVTLTVAPAPITLASITVVPTANLIAQTAPMNGLDVATYTLGPDGATAPDSLFLIFDTTNGQPSTGTQLTQADFTVAEGKVTLKTGKVLQAGTYNFSIATTTDGTGDGAIKSSSVTLTVAPAPITLASITVVPTANLIAQTAPMNGLDVATYTLGPDGATAPDSLFLIFDTTNGQPSTGTQLTQADFTVAEGKVTLKTGKVLQAGTYNFSIATTTDGTGDGAIKSSSVTLTVAPAPITLASITVVPTANLIAQTAPMNGLDVATYTLGPDGATAPDSLFLIFDTTNGQPSTGTQLTQADFTVAEGKVTLKTGKVLQAGTYNFSIATTTDGTGDGAIKSSSVTLTVAPAPITLASITVVPTANLIAQTAPMNGLDVATYTLGPDGATAPDSLFLIFDTTNGQPSTGTQLTQADFTVAEGKVTLKTGKVLQAGTYNFSIATTTDGTGDGAIKSSSVTLTVAPAPITLASITVVPTANLIAQTAPMNGLDVATYTLGPDGATAPDSLFLIFDTTNGQPSTGTQLTQADFTVAEGKVTLKTGKVLQAGTYNFSIATTTDGTGDGAIKSSSVTLTVAPAPITLASITVVPTANLIAQTAPMNGLDVATYTLGPDGATAPDSLFLIFDTTNGQPSTGTQLTQADFTVAEGKVTLKTGKVLQAGTYNFSIATTTDGTGDGAIKSSSVTLTVAPAPITLASITVVPTANLIAQTAPMNGLDVATYTLGPDGATAPDSLFLIFDTTNGQPSTGTQLTQADFTVAEGKVTLKTGKVLQAGTYNFSIATTTDGTGDGAIKSSSVTLTVAPAPITLASITVVPTANLIAQTAPMNGLDVATYTLGPDGATAPDSLFLIFDTTNGQPSTGTQLTQADFTVAEGKVTLKTGKVLQAGTYNFSIATTTDGTGDGAIKSSSVTLTVAPAPITLASITVVPTANLIAQTAPMNGLDVATYTLGPDGATAPDSLFLIFDTTNGQPSTGTQLTQADFTVAEGKVTLKTGKVLQAGTYNFSIATTTDGTEATAIKSEVVTLTVSAASNPSTESSPAS